MYYLFYGENTFLIREKVRSLEEKFRASQGADASVIKLVGEGLTRAGIMEAVFALSIFETKKLVQINNLLMGKAPADLRDFVLKNLEKIPAETVVLFIEEGLPDARTALFKALNKPKQAQKFSELTPIELSRWIKSKVAELGGQIAQEAVSKLSLYVGSDLWRLSQEIEKLVLFRLGQNDRSIQLADVEMFVQANDNTSVFEFIDALAQKNKKRAMTIFHGLVKSGENEQYLLSMMVYQYRQMLIVSDLIGRGVPAAQVSSVAKIHPYVTKKILALLKSYTFSDLKSVYTRLEECDFSIKSGEAEEGLALDLLLLELLRK